MKITVEGTPSEMAEWMREMALGPITNAGTVEFMGSRAEMDAATGRPTQAEQQAAFDLLSDDEPLPGCHQCERYGDDRELCRRAECPYSRVNQAAQMGEG